MSSPWPRPRSRSAVDTTLMYPSILQYDWSALVYAGTPLYWTTIWFSQYNGPPFECPSILAYTYIAYTHITFGYSSILLYPNNGVPQYTGVSHYIGVAQYNGIPQYIGVQYENVHTYLFRFGLGVQACRSSTWPPSRCRSELCMPIYGNTFSEFEDFQYVNTCSQIWEVFPYMGRLAINGKLSHI
jgi:hypothetical protein